MRIKTGASLAVAVVLGAAGLMAQDMPLPDGSIQINFPSDSPLLPVSIVTNQSRATARGAAIVLDLHLALVLRNVNPARPIHGVMLRVVSQEVTVGGKGSVAYPSLHIAPGDSFPVRIDMQLMRPTQSVNGRLVEVNLDGVLYQDLSFYGPDRLNSKRIMTAWELESRRDRDYLKAMLAQGGPDALRNSAIQSLARQAERPRLDVRVVRGGPAVTAAAVAPAGERTATFAFLNFPDSPVQPVEGWALLAGNQVRAPRINVVNHSGKPVRYVELGWVVRDRNGREYMAASLPASDPALVIPPNGTARVLQDTALRFTREGRPVDIQGMSGFVSQVQFADGKVWVPNRQNLQNSSLMQVLPPSAEEQRLTDLYRTKGINALVEELKKY